MSALLYASAFLALVSHHAAPKVTVNVDAKSGDVVSGDRTFKVTVDSKNPVNQVEFYVESDLHDSQTATPYLFHFDTIEEKDGDYKLKFKAYTSESETGETLITIHVDNELSKGAAYHVQKALDYLSDSKWQPAIDQGRIALKIDDKNVDARIALARANLGLKALDKAQKYAEDAAALDPTSSTALQMVAAVNLQRSFSTIAKEGADRTEVLNTIRDSLKAAVDNRRKGLDLDVDKLPATTAENLLKNVDVALKAGRYSLAIQLLTPAYEKDVRNTDVSNRLAYAQLRSYRTTDSIATLQGTKRQIALDAYGQALLSVALADLGKDDESDAAIREAVLADADGTNLGVKTAQAFIALKRNKKDVLSRLVSELQRDNGQRTEINYFLTALNNRLQQYGAASKAFQRAVMTEPAFADLYVEQANYSIGLSQRGNMPEVDQKFQFDSAKTYYQTALAARPEAADALAGMAIVLLLQKNPKDALPYANAAVNAAPNAAAGHYTLSAVASALRMLDLAQIENRKAGKLDMKNLEGRELPNALAAWRYLNTGGRLALIAAP